MRKRHGWAVLLLAAAHGVAFAQTPPDPGTDPNLNDPSLEAKARDMERRVPPGGPIAPAGGAATAPDTRQSQGLGQAPLRREGTFLVRQRGSMVKMTGGEWAFVFHRDPQGQAERPMLLLRSQHLSRMQQLAGQRPEEAAFLVSGQVFAYRGANYLLVAPVPPVLAQPEANGETADKPGGESPAVAPRAMGDDPSTADLLRQLEAQRDRPRALGIPQAPEAAPADRRAALPEGTIINRRRGRLVRVAGGDTAVMFDNDADSAAADPPLVLLPCLTMERMERIASDRGESLVFEVSGRVFAYEGRNYLLPTMFQIYAPSDLERRQ